MKADTATLQALDERLAAGEIPTEAIGVLREAVQHLVSCPRRHGVHWRSTERRAKRGRNASRRAARGHGRHGAGAYLGGERVVVKHSHLKPGDRCPGPGCAGKLFDTRDPATQVELSGGAPIRGRVFERERLRCSTCGQCQTAPLPAEAHGEKYDPSVAATVAVARYEQGIPHHRLEQWQAAAGIPLAASTQFDLVERLADAGLPVLRHLVLLTATSRPLLQSDDTGVSVLSLGAENRLAGPHDRTGQFTTAMLGLGLDHSVPPIVLYASGRRHAGENMDRLLALRGEACPECIHMADASTMRPRSRRLIAARCLVHARRHFVEIESAFPEHCARVLDDIATVYANDKAARDMTPQQRLEYHQRHSDPVLAALRQWADEQIAQRLVEPNSRLGKAFAYLRNHWTGLTRFLHVAGVPLDNNATERAIKPVQRHRKNSLFYLNEVGAAIGDVLMSLIRTCLANRADPIRYLTALGRHRQLARDAPHAWLPWNYLQAVPVN